MKTWLLVIYVVLALGYFITPFERNTPEIQNHLNQVVKCNDHEGVVKEETFSFVVLQDFETNDYVLFKKGECEL